MRLAEYKRKLTIKGIANFEEKGPTAKETEDFLNSLPKEKDPYTLSLNKYKARMFHFDWRYKLLSNTMAFFELNKIHLNNLFNSKKNEEYNKLQDGKSYDMLILEREVSISDVFPEDLYEEFPDYKMVNTRHDGTVIFDKELKDAYRILARKNPFRFEYKLLALKELALHSRILKQYDPKATVVYINERNIYSPILKEIYHSKNKELISFMHGENLFQLLKTYMSFSRYYVWDKKQIDMFKNDMYCSIDQYIEYTPKKLSYKYTEKAEYKKDLTYYISATSKKDIKKLADIAKSLKEVNINLFVRAHPRMTDMEYLKGVYPNELIESFDITTINSIDDSKYIVGLATTVITESYYGGKKILLDDVTNSEIIQDLKEKKYLMLEKIDNDQVNLFSKYLKDKGIEI